MKAIFNHFDEESANIHTFWFKPERHLDYTAGQYTELTVAHDNPDDRGIKRWFTLSSTPGQELVSITTKYAGDDKSSTFKKALFHLQPGAEVQLAEAMGDFVLPKDPSIPLVWTAGGIGLTPFHSMAGWLAAHGEKRDVTFIYGVRSEAEVIFLDTFRSAGIEPIVILSEPDPSWSGKTGRLDAKTILDTAKPAANAMLYNSGPEPMIEALEADLQAAGVAKTQLIGDFFPGYTVL